MFVPPDHSDFMCQEGWSVGYGQDREAGDDNGIADWQGQSEQAERFLAQGGDLNAASR